jgi:uncharacterized protein YdeI (YjbR/CyaY-like superfamily)
MDPIFFETPAEFRGWLAENHATAGHLLVGFHKKGSGRKSMTWPEAVDEALCYGWIDGVRKGIDAGSYTIRFTPRKKGSVWSTVNVNRVRALAELGLIDRPGRVRGLEGGSVGHLFPRAGGRRDARAVPGPPA